jgi:ribosomal protein S18 acetylase RimI-like enzyme
MKPKKDADKRIKLRTVTDDDREFLLRVYEASREIELAMTPWDTSQKRLFAEHQFDAQTRHYRSSYPAATHSIILFDGEPVGRLYADRGEGQIAILDITILPEYRCKGIGTSLVGDMQAEGQRTNKSVSIYMESFNPSQKLFRELGFAAADDDGINIRFEWPANSE